MLRAMITERDRFPAPGWLALKGLALIAGLAAGLPSPGVHGPLHYFGVMGPLCGATRGVAAFARGQVGLAWGYNPASLLLLPGALAVLGRWALGRLTGRWLDLEGTSPRTAFLVTATALLVLTVRQHGNPLLG